MQLELSVDRVGKLREAISWMISHRDCADATRAQHFDHRRWLVEWFGDCPVAEVTFPRVLEYIEAEKTRGIMVASIKKRLVTLRMALENSYRRGHLPHTIDWWPDIASDSKPGQDLWTYDQWRQGRLAFEPEQRIGVDVMFWSGMHTSDVKRWRRSDVDLAKGQWLRYNTKSKADPGWLPLPPDFARILEDWFVAGGIVADSQRVAPDWWASPIRPMARVCQRAAMPRITQLGLRRSCVSYQFELGAAKNMDMKRLSEWVAHWLGHKGDPMTSDIIRRHYMRWTPKALALSSPF